MELDSHKIVISRDINFFEAIFPIVSASPIPTSIFSTQKTQYSSVKDSSCDVPVPTIPSPDSFPSNAPSSSSPPPNCPSPKTSLIPDSIAHCLESASQIIEPNSYYPASLRTAEYRSKRQLFAKLTLSNRLVADLYVPPLLPNPIRSDNQAAIHIAKNPVFHEQRKHTELDSHFVGQQYRSDLICLYFVPYKDQLADVFTKIPFWGFS
ncbi:uncharacterized protein LOC107027626 [Solanum pennellii]|uniref:Uncharacterized protein LOC107027626 n=1 Tax=Solanum pennellii TaxID=28526 RepID=A0ABM1HE64_SOLPN|nr:uncharacterized protein LOC107027626 [Solanum pennellii]